MKPVIKPGERAEVRLTIFPHPEAAIRSSAVAEVSRRGGFVSLQTEWKAAPGSTVSYLLHTHSHFF
jgi:hypothetical protein